MLNVTVPLMQQMNYGQKYANTQILHVKRMGQLTEQPEAVPAGQDYYRVLFITQAVYDYTVGKRAFTLDSSGIGFIKPGECCNLPDVPGVTGYIVSFSRNYLRKVFSSSATLETLQFNISELRTIPVPQVEAGFMQQLFDRLCAEYRHKGINDEMVISLFHILVLFLKRSVANPFPVQGHKGQYHLNHFFTLLDSHFHTCKMPCEYAELMAVTPSYLNCLIKDSFGCTTSHFIQQRIFAEAKRLITYDSLSMKQVAYQLGFDDISHFSKFFKRVAGKRFTEFKRSMVA